MTKSATRRAFITSAVSLLLCVAMLIGSTFAWFTDSASTGTNSIQAGNLKIGLMYKNSITTEWTEVDKESPVFNDEALWEPGYTEVTYFRVENRGSLALKYKIGTLINEVVMGATKEGTEIDLTKFIKFGIVKLEDDAADFASREEAVAAVAEPLDFMEMYAPEQALEAEETDLFAMVVWMPTEVGNEANHDGTNVPEIKFGVNVLATQKDSELDSFDDSYDIDAIFPLADHERFAEDDASLAEILSDLEGVTTVYLAEGDFAPINLTDKSIKLIGATDEDGEPATRILIDQAPTTLRSAGIWNGFRGTAANIVFEAADGIADSYYGGLSLNHVDEANKAKATFKNCHFVNQGIKFYGDVDFINCDFDGNNGNVESAFKYCIATGEILIDGCTFKGYESVTINVAESTGASVMVKNSVFDGADNEIGHLDAITFDNCTLNNNLIIWIEDTVVNTKTSTFGESYGVVNKF